MKAIIVHGGTGSFKSVTDADEHRRGIEEAVRQGFLTLEKINSAEEAVVTAVSVMEEDPTFNCGRGSVLTYRGDIEMDAAIMDNNLNAGAVSGLKRILHPITVARAVMEQTDHVLLAGAELEEFVTVLGFPREDNLIVPKRHLQWKEELEKIVRGEKTRFGKSVKLAKKAEEYHSTCGAVAIDDHGRMAAGTSTGGMMMKSFGRVGDSPIIGAGTYADSFGAVSATGHGEKIMKLTLSRLVAFFMEQYPAQKSVDIALERARYFDCECGLIALDRYGNIGIGHTSKDMSWAFIKDGHAPVIF